MPPAARRRPRPASSYPRSPRGRRTLGRIVAGLLLTAAVAVVPASSAQAFGTVWGILGQHSEHERVTRLGLQCGGGVQPPECFQPVSLDNLAGKRGSFGAVGAADNIPLHLHRDRDYWHCDNSDWVAEALHGIRGRYGQSDRDADRRLYQCVQWGRDKLYGTSEIGGGSFPPATPTWGAVPQARTLVKNGRSDSSNPGVGIFSTTCTYNGVRGLRPKCNVLEPFGYVLHMAEDFYSHTNWADYADPARRLSVQNPIGLGRTDLASFLDLRAGYRGTHPGNFTGSCYPKKSCGDKRVIHGESSRDLGLNKDKGLIDIRTGRVTEPGTPRGAIVVDGVSNVQRAVDMASREARRQWTVFRQALVDEYGAAAAARYACVLTLDRAEYCDRPNVVLAVATGAEGDRAAAGARGARAADADGAGSDAGSGSDDAEVAAGRRLLKGLPRGARVAVVSYDRDSGAQDVDPFVRPAAARIDDAESGDAAPDPDVSREIARDRDPEDDPTITPIADAATPGYTPDADEDFTHGSEEGAQLNEEGEADPDSPQSQLDAQPAPEGEDARDDDDAASASASAPAPASTLRAAPAPAIGGRAAALPAGSAPRGDAAGAPAARAAAAGPDPAATAEALRSARRLLDAQDAPRGQQGVALIADELGDVPLVLEQLRALRRDGVRVALAVHTPRAVPARVLRAVEATGGSVLATHSEAELRRFATVVRAAGMTRLGDAFAHRKAPLTPATPPLLSVTASGRDMHAVEAPPRAAARLRVNALDGGVTAVVRDTRAGTTRRLRVAANRTASLPLRAGRHYELLVAGPDGRRYEASLVR